MLSMAVRDFFFILLKKLPFLDITEKELFTLKCYFLFFLWDLEQLPAE